MSLYGAVEIGGTKTLVATGTTATDLSEPFRIATTDPKTTLDAVVRHLSDVPIDAVGVASFGPIELRPGHPAFGRITNTPKAQWGNADVLGVITDSLDLPAGIDTDVNGAARGEGRWGAAVNLSDFVYVTIGTGIGGGAVAGGRTIGGLSHPELGHMTVEAHPEDDYPGRCPYHGNCLEGMTSGPALEDRYGPYASWGEGTGALELAVYYVAQGLRNLVYILAPQRVIVGGGVARIEGFHTVLGSALVDQLAGYPPVSDYESPGFVVAPGLGDRSSLAGGLILAAEAAD